MRHDGNFNKTRKMSTYSPSLTTELFHTKAAMLSMTAEDVMDQLVSILFPFGMVSLAVLVITSVTRELARRKYLTPWKYMYTPAYFSLMVIAITGIVVLALTGLGIQTAAYTSEIDGAKQLRTTVRRGVIDVDKTIKNLEIDCDVTHTFNLSKYFDYMNTQVKSMQSSVEEYSNDAIEAVNIMRMSASFLIVTMLFVISAGSILYISAYLKTLIGWHYTIGIHILAVVFYFMSALLLLVLTLQANTCMDPTTSVANLWTIDDPLLAYYVNCSVDTSLRNPIADTINIADDICSAILAEDRKNQIDITKVTKCAKNIATGCKLIVNRMQCVEMSKGIIHLVNGLCVESINALAFVFIASTLMFVMLLFTTFTLSINVPIPKLGK